MEDPRVTRQDGWTEVTWTPTGADHYAVEVEGAGKIGRDMYVVGTRKLFRGLFSRARAGAVADNGTVDWSRWVRA